MDLRENTAVEVHARHPWERARAHLVRRLVQDQLPVTTAVARVLDVGAGDGWLARELADRFGQRVSITCLDPNYSPAVLAELEAAAPPNLTHVTDVDGTFDLVLALDVMEHVEDDGAFVERLAGRLRPSGNLIVTVPAHQSLFGPHDVALGHFRRYGRGGLVGLLDDHGFRVTESGHLFASLYLARAAQLRRKGDAPPHDASEEYLRWGGPEWLARAITAGLVAEGRLTFGLRRLGPDLSGLSCWAVAQKTSG
jgi:SAM-dependent methyltransferase